MPYNLLMKTEPVTCPVVRRAVASDQPGIQAIVSEQDLDYPSMKFTSFWVTLIGADIASILRLEEFETFYFISAVGSASARQGQGCAGRLLQTVLAGCQRPVYLYTVIPAFFARFGFQTVTAPSWIPPRTLFDCPRCQPELCACMVFTPVRQAQT